MSETKKSRRRFWLVSAYAVMVGLATAAAGYSLLLRHMAGTFMYDSNIDTFMNVLNAEQREGIYWSVRVLLTPAITLLVVTNLCWIVGVGIGLLWRPQGVRIP